MSLFEIGNYVIIKDIYLGKIVKKIWNGYGIIVKLDNNKDYIDNTILQYHLVSDINTNNNINGFMLVNSNTKIRLVDKNKLFELIKYDLKTEKFVYIDNKINKQYNFFIKNILPKNYPNIIGNLINDEVRINQEEYNKNYKFENIKQIGGYSNNNSQLITNNSSLINNSSLTNNSQLNNNLHLNKEFIITDKNYNPYNTKNKIYPYVIQFPKLINTATAKQENLLNKNPNIIYQNENIQEDNYEKYIKNMISNLFINENIIDYEDEFKDDLLTANQAEKLDILQEGQRDHVIKPTIKKVLERFDKIDSNLYLDLTNTLLYKHIITDNKLDTVSFGVQLINIIKDLLIKMQTNIKFDDGRSLLDEINLFNFIKFKISGGYIIIVNKNNEIKISNRIITNKLVPNLQILANQYNNSIDYKILSNIILQNKSSLDIENNKQIIEEAINILAQDYYICLQTRVEYLLWTLTRLLLCWYAEPFLSENILEIKILINLYRARGIKNFNQDIGVQPVILIIPKYGKESALKILSFLSYYFFPYKKVGWINSSPSYFTKVDNLIYYTNGSIDLKKYIKFLIKSNSNIINPLSADFTKINLASNLNDIEYSLPSN